MDFHTVGQSDEPASSIHPSRAAFNVYIGTVESRLERQHHASGTILAQAQDATVPVIEQLPGTAVPGALLHHWRGTAFAPGATAAQFEQLLRDFSAYPRLFAPQVLQASALRLPDGRLQASMRVRQKHVITVVLDSTYDVSFGQRDPRHGYSLSRSTRIAEIGAPGTDHERDLSPAEEHGFLWRQNTYWTYEERDGGLALQIESVSLTRDLPAGLGWALRPYVESVPRDSLEFTLRAVCNALRR